MVRVVIALVVTGVLGSGVAGWAGYGPARFAFDSKFLKLCEVELKSRLRSPSTYRRVSVDAADTVIGVDEIDRYQDDVTAAQRKRIADGSMTPMNFALLIRYDAANAYGTPVAGISACEYYSAHGSLDNVIGSFIRIDGETSFDRLMRSVAAR